MSITLPSGVARQTVSLSVRENLKLVCSWAVVDNSVKDYFTDKYNEDKDKLYIPNTERSTLTYVAMKNHCDARNIRVLNATRGGKLEVFPRIEFDSLFK